MSSPAFPINTAQIVGLFMESVFYGMYLVTFGSCMHILLSPNGKSRNYPMLTAALLMFIFATFDVAFGLQHNLEAFIYFKGPGGADAEFAEISNWVNVMKTADYIAQTFVGDCILIYRCFVVYNRNWLVVAFPIAMWLAGSVCGWIVVYIEATLHTDAFLNQVRLVPFITSVLALTLATNVVTTALIVHRIWKINAETTAAQLTRVCSASRLSRAIRILVESGLMYTLSVIVFFGTFIASNNAQYGVSDAVVQIIGITFNLIIIRVSQGTMIEPSALSSAPKSMSFPMHLVSIETRNSADSPIGDTERGDAGSRKGGMVKGPWGY